MRSRSGGWTRGSRYPRSRWWRLTISHGWDRRRRSGHVFVDEIMAVAAWQEYSPLSMSLFFYCSRGRPGGNTQYTAQPGCGIQRCPEEDWRPRAPTGAERDCGQHRRPAPETVLDYARPRIISTGPISTMRSIPGCRWRRPLLPGQAVQLEGARFEYYRNLRAQGRRGRIKS